MTLCIHRLKRFVGIYMNVDYHPLVFTALIKVFEHRFTHFGLGLRLYNKNSNVELQVSIRFYSIFCCILYSITSNQPRRDKTVVLCEPNEDLDQSDDNDNSFMLRG